MKTPDWEHWLALPNVKAWEALILSFNFCPDDFSSRYGWDCRHGSPPGFSEIDFHKKLRLLNAHLTDTDFFIVKQKMKAAHLWKITLEDFSKWAIQKMKWDNLPENLVSLLDDNQAIDAKSLNAELTRPIKNWTESAREIAEELFERDTSNGARDSCTGYAKRVMDEMAKRDIRGPRGLIDNPNTVKRDALQGKLWWATKTK